MTEVLYGLDAAERQRVAALRDQGSFYWLDVLLSETTLDDLRDAAGVPERVVRALRGSGQVAGSRRLHADDNPSSSRSTPMSRGRRRTARTACEP